MVKLLILLFVVVIAAGGAYLLIKKNSYPAAQLSLNHIQTHLPLNPVPSVSTQAAQIPNQPLTEQNVDQSLNQTVNAINSDTTQLDKDLQSVDQASSQSNSGM